MLNQSVIKISTPKSVAFLCTNNKLSERKVKITILFTIASKRLRYLGINLTREVKYLYIENYKTLMKQIEEDTNRCKDIPCLWTGRINIVKMFVLPKATYRFNVLLKFQQHFHRTIKNNPKLCMEPQKTLNSYNNFEKGEQSWRHHMH